MGTKNTEVIRLEVKYCENCGGLWIRKQGDEVVYCSTCRELIYTLDAMHESTPAPSAYV